MYDPVLENEKDGIPAPPTKHQWVMRDEQLGRQKDAAVINARIDTNSSPDYCLQYDNGYDFYFTLADEMERCFRSGCWIASICVGSAAIDAFFYEVWGITKGNKIEEKLKEMNFPHIGIWQLIRKNRNNIIHITEESNYPEQNNYDLHYIAKKTVWFVHYYRYYMGFSDEG
jgi:hypothetical protein